MGRGANEIIINSPLRCFISTQPLEADVFVTGFLNITSQHGHAAILGSDGIFHLHTAQTKTSAKGTEVNRYEMDAKKGNETNSGPLKLLESYSDRFEI